MDDVLSSGVGVLPEPSWRARRDAHEARVDVWLEPHLARRRNGVPHPVEDFLFTYYSQRPAGLRRWHPGFGVVLENGEEYLGHKGYGATPAGVTVTRDHLAAQDRLLGGLRTLLTATASRPAQLGCFGMHEWAMVYRLEPGDVRHAAWPLRLGPEDTDAVVESHRIACSHFDAFRFFTDEARPRNALQPGRDDRAELEQPGCLHAGMDLYGRCAYGLTPMIPSELVADTFEHALAARSLDMRASPYDFSDLGYEPVRIETAEGKAQYVREQRALTERSADLRARLIAECERLLAVVESLPHGTEYGRA